MAPTTTSFCRLEEVSWRGFSAYLLDNGLVRATVVPALGGKIASLVHLGTGREWLWKNPYLNPKAPRIDQSFVESHDTGGFDECFPSVAATRFPAAPWEGTPVPDHGELWSLPWKCEPFCDGQRIELRMQAHGVRFPYRFERSIHLRTDDPALRMAYAVHNPTPYDFPFVWCAHPIFQVDPGVRLVVPLKQMTVYASIDDRFGRLGTSQSWPNLVDRDGRVWDLSACPEKDRPMAVKLFDRAPSLGYVALQDPAFKTELRMQFDPETVTHLGLWLNFGGWSGVPGSQPYYNLGLEPGIGVQDDLATAYHHFREYGVAPAFGRRAWQLDLILR